MDEATARACREHALGYLERSHTAATPDMKRMFIELAQSWNFLADEIDRARLNERTETSPPSTPDF
jgi:hypothetical protein